MELPGKDNKVVTGSVIAIIGAGVGALFGADPEQLVLILSKTAQSQIAQAGFFFALAAWIHSGKVRKSIDANFGILTTAINNVALTLREDLKKQAEILADYGQRIETVEKTINGKGEKNA